jgi:hypothetical protein
MGQLERLTLKREHGLELFSGGEGHGEPPGIDWAHDYVAAGSFQKLRITYWDACPDYEVVRGPLCHRSTVNFHSRCIRFTELAQH